MRPESTSPSTGHAAPRQLNNAPEGSGLYPELIFGGYSRRDGTVAFYARVNALVDPAMVVLDYGCGTGAHYAAEDAYTRTLQRLQGKVRQVIGADLDRSAEVNPIIDRFVLVEDRLPIEDASIDLCVIDWGVEHFADPINSFRDIRRVLKPGGYLCIRTPNVLHYSSVGARLVPFRFHSSLRRWLGQCHTNDDVFPVLYRANTPRALRRVLEQARFGDVVIIRHRGESHFRDVGPAWAWLGEWIERLSPPLIWHELHAFARRAIS